MESHYCLRAVVDNVIGYRQWNLPDCLFRPLSPRRQYRDHGLARVVISGKRLFSASIGASFSPTCWRTR